MCCAIMNVCQGLEGWSHFYIISGTVIVFTKTEYSAYWGRTSHGYSNKSIVCRHALSISGQITFVQNAEKGIYMNLFVDKVGH